MRLQIVKRIRIRSFLMALLLLTSFFMVGTLTAGTAPDFWRLQPQDTTHGFLGPNFSKTFLPDRIGPGSASTLRFTLSNTSSQSVESIAFTDNMPAAIIVADAPKIENGCDGTVTAVSGSNTITLSDGKLLGNASCTLSVQVTSSTVGTHTNTTGNLTSSAGSGGTATDDLTVDAALPGFTKSFSPGTIDIGGRSTLTFTVDNTLNSEALYSISFSDELPEGMAIANPANFGSDCAASLYRVVSAESGSTTLEVDMQDLPVVAEGASCTLSVDVVAASSGTLENSSSEIFATVGSFGKTGGKANAALGVETAMLLLRKQFVGDPSPPGGTVAVRYQIDNRDRSNDATNVSFTDDFDAALSDLAAVGLPRSNDCGASTLSGTGMISLSNGFISAGATCVFTVTLQIPGGAALGSYPSTTSAISGQLDGKVSTGTSGSDTLFVFPAPLFSKQFVDDPVAAGDDVSLQFTITNSSLTATATDIRFDDDLTAYLPFPVSATLPSDPCGSGSSLTLVSPSTDQHVLRLLDGTLSASDTCTFSVIISIPSGFASGIYLNETTNIVATVEGESFEGDKATDTLEVVSAPTVRKSFIDDPVLPGETVTLEYTIEHDAEEPGDATAIGFTDDLTAVLTGLVAIDLPKDNICGVGSRLSGSTLLTFSGGRLSVGESCTFSVTLQMSSASTLPGRRTSSTSNISAEVLGLAVTELPATDELIVGGLAFSMAFPDAPTIPGDTVTLAFTLENESDTFTATGMTFSNDLKGMADGITAVAPLPTNPCGAGSSLISSSADTFITLIGGELAPNSSCTFAITLQVDSSVPASAYSNITSELNASLDGSAVEIDPASANITIGTNMLQLSKQYVGEAPLPGEKTTLRFTVQNLHQVYIASSLTFTDDLEASLSGLVAVPPLPSQPCGAGSQLTGTSQVVLSNAVLPPDGQCQFEVTIKVPDDVDEGDMYENTTSQASATMDTFNVFGAPASDTLIIGSAPTEFYYFFPLIHNDVYVEPSVMAPDLVISNLVVRDGLVEMLIWNRGNAAVTRPFWVDLYINPTTPPTKVNQLWKTLGTHGAVWGVQGAVLPLPPNASLTLTLNDAYFFEALSEIPASLPLNTAIYAQVDSANATTTYGAVAEAHEIEGKSYNNIIGPIHVAP